MGNRRKIFATIVAAGLLAAALAVPAGARKGPVKGEGKNMKPIVNIPWTGGTDMEIATIKGRDYAFASSTAALADNGGLHVIDVTVPEKAKEVGRGMCTLNQGDVQVTHDQKHVLVASDGAGGPEGCLGVGKSGFLVYDISNPKKPKPVGFGEAHGGSHNMTAHPAAPYVYNSNSELAGSPEIQIFSIKNPAKPVLVNTVDSLPHATHDIAFNSDGSMAVTAAISHWDLWDTSDPENPTLLFETQCPGCSITHDAKFTPDDSGVIIGDEAGGGATFPCPGGALYFYQLQGTDTQPVPVLTGIFEPHTVIFPQGTTAGSCTSHVFEISDDGTHLAIAWYASGVHYINIGDMIGAAWGDQGAGNIKREAWFIPEGGSTWSAKLHNDEPYMYTNDRQLGFILYKISAP